MALKTRSMLVVGIAVGYVLGARAGRGRYEQIAGAARRVWNTPGIQAPVEKAKGFAANSVGALPGLLVSSLVKAVAAGFSSPQSRTGSAKGRPEGAFAPGRNDTSAGSGTPDGSGGLGASGAVSRVSE